MSPARSALSIAIALALLAAVVWAIARARRGRPRADVAKEIAEPVADRAARRRPPARGPARRACAIYDAMVAGAREGLDVVVRIVPYLVAILVAVGMFRASGALDLIIGALDPVTQRDRLSRRGAADGAIAAALGLRLFRGDGGDPADPRAGLASWACSRARSRARPRRPSTCSRCTSARPASARCATRSPACLIGDLAGFAGATAACHLFFD